MTAASDQILIGSITVPPDRLRKLRPAVVGGLPSRLAHAG